MVPVFKIASIPTCMYVSLTSAQSESESGRKLVSEMHLHMPGLPSFLFNTEVLSETILSSIHLTCQLYRVAEKPFRRWRHNVINAQHKGLC